MRAIAPAGWIAQRVATEEPCTLVEKHGPLLGLTGTVVNVWNMYPDYNRVNPTQQCQTHYTSAGHLAASLHVLLFSFGKPKNKYVSPRHTRAFLNRTLYPPVSVPEFPLQSTCLALFLQKGLATCVSSRPKENLKGKRRLLGLRPPSGFGESVVASCG